jgi:hypothetical protein
MRILLAAVLLSVSVSAEAQVLKQEPGPGTLRRGMSVLVDDGTCGKGKIKRVTGGSQGSMTSGEVSVNRGSAIPRTRECIPR